MSAGGALLTAAVVAVAACDGSRIADPPATEAGLAFELGGQSHVMSGTPSGDPTQILNATFAAAHADSLDGLAVIGYERTGENEGNLVVLQAPRAAGTYTCPEGPLPCDMRSAGAEWHGRYIIGVRNLSTTGAQRYYHLVAGTLVVSSIGPDRLRATFTAVLRPQDDPADAITISSGSIDVPYVSSPDAAALLQCLIGSGGSTCGQ
jgi:hypothetical protein